MWWFKVGSKPQCYFAHQQVSASLCSAAHSDVESPYTALKMLLVLLVLFSIASAFFGFVQSTGRSVVVGEQSRSKSCRQKLICVFPDRLWAASGISKALGIYSGACQETGVAVAGMVCDGKGNTECVHLVWSCMLGLRGCFAMWTTVVRQRNVKHNQGH